MIWTDGDLKIFAAGLSIGGQWNCSGAAALPPPTADPPAGAYYGQVLYIRLMCDTPGAVIRFTTNGDAPAADGPLFDPEMPIEVSASTTIRAYAQAENRTSRIANFRYAVDNPFLVTDTVTLARAVPQRWADAAVVTVMQGAAPEVTDRLRLADAIPAVSDDAVVEIVTGGS